MAVECVKKQFDSITNTYHQESRTQKLGKQALQIAKISLVALGIVGAIVFMPKVIAIVCVIAAAGLVFAALRPEKNFFEKTLQSIQTGIEDICKQLNPR